MQRQWIHFAAVGNNGGGGRGGEEANRTGIIVVALKDSRQNDVFCLPSISCHYKNWPLEIPVLGWLSFLLFNPLKRSGTICWNMKKFCMLSADCIYVFHVILRIKTDHFSVRHWSIDPWNEDALWDLRFSKRCWWRQKSFAMWRCVVGWMITAVNDYVRT